ncbi:MAG: RNA polymerase sigma factor [Sedimentisphaerales bacterium]|nr:RNA polymerase sigma factor [Sedimentisphaerales bacterium]
MLEDKILVWKLKRGSSDALRRIYEKYKDDLLALAIALSNDRTVAEDVLHDVFVSFAEYAVKLQLRTSLKSYLLSCVVNRIRSLHSIKSRQNEQVYDAEDIEHDCNEPVRLAILTEQSKLVELALSELPYQQREVIVLHINSQIRFKDIAEMQGESINTIQSRYRYGLEKLKLQLNGKV